MKFYTFDQNNSGGVFVYDKERGITRYVIIEAADEKQVVDRAEEIGLYFNGIAAGTDCPCCGDRWSHPWEDPTDAPEVWGVPVENVDRPRFLRDDQKEIAVHYADGRIEWFC